MAMGTGAVRLKGDAGSHALAMESACAATGSDDVEKGNVGAATESDDEERATDVMANPSTGAVKGNDASPTGRSYGVSADNRLQ